MRDPQRWTAADPTGMLGTLEAETAADLVIVDGDPTHDVTVLQEAERIVGVMKAGRFEIEVPLASE